MKYQLFLFSLFITLPTPLHAAGQKKPDQPETPQIQTPHPTRAVRLHPVGTKAFVLPNGLAIPNLSLDIQPIFESAVSKTDVFLPMTGNDDSPAAECDTELQVKADISTLELNIAEGGIRFGYSPQDSHSPITGATGEVTVHVGAVSMDFRVVSCSRGRCTTIGADSVTHHTVDIATQFTINFDQIKTTADFALHPAMSKILRTMLEEGMQLLSHNKHIPELAWRAHVKEVDSNLGTLLFDAGFQDRLKPQQKFVVYAVDEATGECDLFKSVAYIHTLRVDPISSLAVVDEVLNERGVQVGDVIMVSLVPEGSLK